ncbi:MerR family transcriptional regulator [Solicola sp. PLA-1-18]|uniref:MerR family transcriptional regulator n=1 Tax=Solicola sp. PLA-1-18 TaxID=3380532 RepID=UPI003B791579
MSELVERSGVPRATVKFYLREGLLPAGVASGPTQATYDETHLHRLRLVRVLVQVAGLSLAQVRRVVDAVEDTDADRYEALGRALGALPPHGAPDDPGLPRARAALESLGQVFDPAYPATAQLERALAGLEEAGIPLDGDRLRSYAAHVRGLAEDEVAAVEDAAGEPSVEAAVLGTVLHEPLILALRRLAHQDVTHGRGMA